MKKIAFAHSVEPSKLRPEITLLRESLHRQNIATELTNWRDPHIPWQDFDAVFMRPCSEYFLYETEFYQWLDTIDLLGIPAINSTQTIRWNMNKRYLQELQQHGIAIVPSCFIAQGSTLSLTDTLNTLGWSEIIIKPSVSAGAYETFRFYRNDAPAYQASAQRILATTDLIIQPFLPAILEEGEWSLLFIKGQLSHAVIKRAKAGDFRIQDVHGGTYERIIPPPALVELATQALHCCPDQAIYGRVDGVFDREAFLIMEIELIEPFLYSTVNEALIDQLTREIAAYVT